MKGDGDFGSVFGGISSLQVGPRAVWTHAAERGFGLAELSRWMAERPAALAGLGDRGRIAVGQRADLCAFDPGRRADRARRRACGTATRSRPYDGAILRGSVLQTWLAGAPVYERVGAAGMRILVLEPEHVASR